MDVQALGYLGIGASDVMAWRPFAERILGMQAVRVAGGSLALRMDERPARVHVHPADADGLIYAGWELADAAALRDATGELHRHGIEAKPGEAAAQAARGVAGLISFIDPLGVRIELFHGPVAATEPFAPSRPHAGFRTGALGMGHVMMTTERSAEAAAFYREVLGFRLSDYLTKPFPGSFLHVNGRHHSVALLGGAKTQMHHFMVECLSIDDVGKAYDAALAEDRVGTTLGRHTNDHVLSFYAVAPGGILAEVGWGGRSVDDATWRASEVVDGPSIWGHERLRLSAELRANARAMREQAAAKGLRAPVHVAPGEFEPIER